MLLATSRHLRQSELARRKIIATQTLDDVMTRWAGNDFRLGRLPDACGAVPHPVRIKGVDAAKLRPAVEQQTRPDVRRDRSIGRRRLHITISPAPSDARVRTVRLAIQYPDSQRRWRNAASVEVLAARLEDR